MKKLVVVALVLCLAAMSISPATAGKKGKKGKKGPKKWVSEDVDVTTGHLATLVAGVGLVRTPFEANCAIPATQGTDAWVFEVPEQFQSIQTTISSFGSGGHDIDIFVYDSNCSLTGQFDSATEDEIGFAGPGSAYIMIANYRVGPMTARIELEKTKAATF